MKKLNGIKGFTLIEIVITIFIVAMLSGMFLPIFNKLRENTRATKLKNDVVELNKSIKNRQMSKGAAYAYLLDGVASVSEVVKVLSSSLSGSDKSRIIGLSGESVPKRIVPALMSKSDAGKAFAIWDSKANQFVFVKKGSPEADAIPAGKTVVAYFRASDDDTRQTATLDLRNENRPMEFAAENDSWVWGDDTPIREEVKLSFTPSSEQDGTYIEEGAVPMTVATLQPPSFSLGDGADAGKRYDEYGLQVSIINPNPTDTFVEYKIDDGAWVKGSSIAVANETKLTARVVSIINEGGKQTLSYSSEISQSYHFDEVQLNAPEIIVDGAPVPADAYGALILLSRDETPTRRVYLKKTGPSPRYEGITKLQYKICSTAEYCGEWTDYNEANPPVISVENPPIGNGWGADIHARAVAMDKTATFLSHTSYKLVPRKLDTPYTSGKESTVIMTWFDIIPYWFYYIQIQHDNNIINKIPSNLYTVALGEIPSIDLDLYNAMQKVYIPVIIKTFTSQAKFTGQQNTAYPRFINSNIHNDSVVPLP